MRRGGSKEGRQEGSGKATAVLMAIGKIKQFRVGLGGERRGNAKGSGVHGRI